MNEQNRSTRTNEALLGAIGELLEKKEFDAITVRQICERARVSKATFYKHFEDKYALVIAWILADLKPPTALFTEDMTQYFGWLLDTMYRYRKQIDHIMQLPGGNLELQLRVFGIWQEGFLNYYAQKQPLKADVPPEISAMYNCSGAIHLVWWLMRQDYSIPKDKLVAYLVYKIEQPNQWPRTGDSSSESAHLLD